MPNLKECLVVPTKVLQESGIIPTEIQDGYSYFRIGGFEELKRLLQVVEEHGKYMLKDEPEGVDGDPPTWQTDFQQLIMYGFYRRNDGRFLLYQRASGADYTETRLAGKVAVGIGGHMDRTDLDLMDSFLREFDEEAFIVENGRNLNFRNENGSLNLELLKRYVGIRPRGLLKDERDTIGRVHLGVVCEIEPKAKGIEIHVRAGEGYESKKSMYVTPKEYLDMQASGEIKPEGWTDIVFREEINM